MGAIGWENIGSTFIDNSGIFIDMGTGVMSAGGKIIGLSFADAIGNGIEALLPTRMDAIILGLRPLFGIFGDEIGEALFGANEAMKQSAITFDDHDEVITRLLEDMQILMSEGYAEFIRLAELQKEKTEGSTGAVNENANSLGEWLNVANKVPESQQSIAEAIEEAIFVQKIQNEIQMESRKIIMDNLNAAGQLAGALGKLNEASKGSALVTARLQQASIIASTSAGAMAAISPPTGAPTPAGWMNFAAVIAAGSAQVISISHAMGDFKKAATGMNEVVTKPTMILAGEAGAESVQITPLNSAMNVNGVQGGGSSAVTVNVSGNVLSQDFVEGELAENIKEAIRRGTDFGIS